MSESSKIETYLSSDVRFRRLKAVQSALDDETFLVGGSLRDILLDREDFDIDLTVGLAPEEIASRLEAAGFRVIPTGLKHQTVTVLLEKDGSPVEITSFHGPGMHPESGAIVGSSIEEDLSYRDFTINALAYSLLTNTLHDPSGGLSDLKNKMVRAVGKANDRFTEDPLRVLRLVRISSELQFSIESKTADAAKDNVSLLSDISPERIRDELSKLLVSPDVFKGLKQLQELGILNAVLPEMSPCVNFEQNKFHLHDVYTHTMHVTSNISPTLLGRLAAFFHDIGKPKTLSVDKNGERHFYRHEIAGADIAKKTLKRLRFQNSVVESVGTLVKTHMRPHTAGPAGIRRLLRDTGELYPLWRELKEADAKATKTEGEDIIAALKEFDKKVEAVKSEELERPSILVINGRDLLELGFKEGPHLGDTLNLLQEQVLDDPKKNERAYLLAEAKRFLEGER